MSAIKHRSPVVRSFRLVLRMPSEADERIAAADLPDACARLLRLVVKRTRLWPGEKADVARELIDHMHDALGAEQSPESIVERFGDPAAAAKLIRRARKRQRHPLMRAWTAAVKITVVSPLILLGLYGILWARFHIGDPRVTTNYAAMIEARWPDAGPGDPPHEIYELARIRWNDIAIALDKRAMQDLRDTDWSHSPASDVPHVNPAHPMYAEVVAAFRTISPELDAVADAATRPGHGTPLSADITYSETYQDASVDHEDRLYTLRPFPDEIEDQPPVWSVLLPHLGSMRTHARLLAFDARLALSEGDTERFVARTLSQLDLARQASEDGFIISNLVAMAVHALAASELGRALRDHADVLSSDQLSRLAHALAASGDRVETIHFEFERFGASDVLQRSFTDNGLGHGRLVNESFGTIANFGVEDFGPVPDTYKLGRGGRLLAPIIAVIVADRRTQHEIIDQQLAIAEGSLARGPAAMPELIAAREEFNRRFDRPFARVRYFVAAIYSPATDRLLATVFKTRAMSDATLVALAIESYRRDQGFNPMSIGDLVPRYLPAAPEDPFAPGEPLRLWVGGESPVIYSVGQDADDDGGQPMVESDGDRAHHSFRTRYASELPDRETGGRSLVTLVPSDRAGDGDWVLFPPAD